MRNLRTISAAFLLIVLAIGCHATIGVGQFIVRGDLTFDNFSLTTNGAEDGALNDDGAPQSGNESKASATE